MRKTKKEAHPQRLESISPNKRQTSSSISIGLIVNAAAIDTRVEPTSYVASISQCYTATTGNSELKRTNNAEAG